MGTLTVPVILGTLNGFAQNYVPEEGYQELTKKEGKW